MRSLAPVLCLALAAPVFAQTEEPKEIPIKVPTPIPVGFLVAWKPTLLSVRVDSGAGSQFGSDKVQLLRGLFRWTTTLFDEQLMARAEIEGGQFESDTQGTRIGSNGADFTVRVLGGTAPHEHEADHEQRDGTAESPRQQQPGPHAERQAA